jgi:hypothetical protein
MVELHDRGHAGDVFVVPEPGAAWRDAAGRRNAGSFDQRTADAAQCEARMVRAMASAMRPGRKAA